MKGQNWRQRQSVRRMGFRSFGGQGSERAVETRGKQLSSLSCAYGCETWSEPHPRPHTPGRTQTGDCFNLQMPNVKYSRRTAPLTSKVAFYIFIQQIQVLNILNMVYTLCFLSSKCSLFHNSNVFGSCVIHILYTGCAQIKKNNSGVKRLTFRRLTSTIVDVPHR